MQISYIKKTEDPIPKKLRVAAYARVSSGKDCPAPFIIRTDYFLQRPDTA